VPFSQVFYANPKVILDFHFSYSNKTRPLSPLFIKTGKRMVKAPGFSGLKYAECAAHCEHSESVSHVESPALGNDGRDL
jgi:hypothetical protein